MAAAGVGPPVYSTTSELSARSIFPAPVMERLLTTLVAALVPLGATFTTPLELIVKLFCSMEVTFITPPETLTFPVPVTAPTVATPPVWL